MNKYDYLINTHDLKSLTDWGPFARDIYALSHIADRKRGIKFDFVMIPGILRRSFFPPETLRECNCSPYEAAPDLSYFSIRQQMEGQDVFYADSAYANIGKDLWLGRCEFVNKTDELRAGTFMTIARLAPRPDVTPFVPEGARFIDALDYKELFYSYKRHDHNLTFCGGRRGEQNYPGTVRNPNRIIRVPSATAVSVSRSTTRPRPALPLKKATGSAMNLKPRRPTDRSICVSAWIKMKRCCLM